MVSYHRQSTGKILQFVPVHQTPVSPLLIIRALHLPQLNCLSSTILHSVKMKLLGWMNRKLRQDSIEPRKTFSIGNSCACLSIQPSFGKQLCHMKHGYTSKQTKRECSKYSAGFTAMKREEVNDEEADLFHGFLTVGTLGSESRVAEPPTPKFAVSYQNVNEKKIEVTETELKLMNDKLEKFLEAESADDVDYDSSRSSFVSTITLSNHEIEGNDVEENRNMVICPLQEYLFNSSTESLETGKEMKKEKGSLEEQKEEGTPFKGKCAMEFMKKILKKIHVSSRSSKASASDHASCTASPKRKFPKTLRLLNKKIHPERSIADKKMSKSPTNKDMITKHQDTGVAVLEKDNNKFTEMIISKENVTTMNMIKNDSLHRSHSTGFGEHWIKTDADYLVLEL
ncbi:Ethylene insensitive 3-like protein [Heracleum sosnowskyi]|uniref:Ethylene insensitive 3-like protein n=1 Tax=Heracleum sosnowskyi TaxID=360622 RepID=A0AAD8H353_9APIA|nr:Ethylene insensitive 3-like protein [Heracleum sosnowskyi]